MADNDGKCKDEAQKGILSGKEISRRDFLKVAGAAGATIGLAGGIGGIVAACGDETPAAGDGTSVSVGAEAGREIKIGFVAKTEVRTHPSLMPEAPALAVQDVLAMCDLTMDDMAVVKNHNPFAVNDVIFAQVTGYDWHKMNNTGCPLVWGHPQGPTLTRVLIEALEEAVDLGGGYVLVFGCAAGDVGIAAVLQVS